MRKPTRLSLYLDVKEVLDAALLTSGGSFVCATHSAAVTWRHRAYRFRKAYYETFHDAKYDALMFPQIPKESTSVEIKLASSHRTGFFLPNEDVSDALSEAAKALANKLDGDLL